MPTRPRFLSPRLAAVAALLAMLWATTVAGSAFAQTSLMLEGHASSRVLVAVQTDIARAECLIYAVYDADLADSQFMTIDPQTSAVTPFGPLYVDYDLEGIDIDPSTDILYAVSGSDNRQNQKGYLYMVDAVSGQLFPVGPSGYDELPALSIRPTDNSLWSWSEGDGLLELDKATGAATLSTASRINVEGLAWNGDGTILYGVAGSRLYEITPGGAVQEIASNLPGSGQVESLETRADGLLMGGFHRSSDLNIFAYDPTTLQSVKSQNITTPYNDIESVAYPERCGLPDIQPTPTPGTATATPSVTATPEPTATATATPEPTTTATAAPTTPPATPTTPPVDSTPSPSPAATSTPTPAGPSPTNTPVPPVEDEPTPTSTPSNPPADSTPTSTPANPPAPEPTSTPSNPPADSTPTNTPIPPEPTPSATPSTPPASTPTAPPAQPPAAPPAQPQTPPPAPVAAGEGTEAPQALLGATEEDEPATSRPRAALSNLGATSGMSLWLGGLALIWMMLGVTLRRLSLRRN